MKSLSRLLLMGALFSLQLSTAQASVDVSLCEQSGIVFGFFNGVQTTEKKEGV